MVNNYALQNNLIEFLDEFIGLANRHRYTIYGLRSSMEFTSSHRELHAEKYQNDFIVIECGPTDFGCYTRKLYFTSEQLMLASNVRLFALEAFEKINKEFATFRREEGQ